MTRLRRKLDAWLSGQLEPTEVLVSWATLGYPAPPDTLIFRPLHQHVSRVGLDPAAQVAWGERQLVLVLTNR